MRPVAWFLWQACCQLRDDDFKMFKQVIKVVPIPIAGVALGTASLGRLLGAWSSVAYILFGCLSALCLVLLGLRIILYPRTIRDDLENSIMASTSGTLFMTLMLLSTYLAPLVPVVAFFMWVLALACHGVLIVWFTWYHIRHLELHKVLPSYFICYVGIIVGSVTSSAYGQQALGFGLFWFGFACYAVLFVVVTVRYAKHEVPEAARPLFCIYAAPMSLSIVGYIATEPFPNGIFIGVMLVLAQFFWVVVVLQLRKLLRLRFYPSYAAMTFPFVITATALLRAREFFFDVALFDGAPPLASLLDVLIVGETAFATIMVCYVFGHYVRFFYGSLERPELEPVKAEEAETAKFEEYFED